MTFEPDVLLVGPWPPPRGGVSAHVVGLAECLEDDGVTVRVLNHFSSTADPRVIAALRRNPIRYLIEIRRLRPAILHYHHSRLTTLLATAAARRVPRGTWIVTFHSQTVERHLRSRVPFARSLTRWALGRFDELVAVSEPIGRSISAAADRPVTVAAAYLPPRLDSNREVRAGSPPALIASASKVAGGPARDVYRLDFVTDVFIALAPRHPDLGLELYLARGAGGRRSRAYLADLRFALEQARLLPRVSIHVDSSLEDAFHPRAVYLRPTLTEGDSVSVREALHHRTPVIASDVVPRPAGVLTLPADELDAWVDAADRALREPAQAAEPAADPVSDPLLELYREIRGQPA